MDFENSKSIYKVKWMISTRGIKNQHKNWWKNKFFGIFFAAHLLIAH